MMNKRFFDTCSLLLYVDKLFKEPENIYISSVTLEELEHIKTSANKDYETKILARHLARKLDQHFGEYHVVIYNPSMAFPGAEMTPDMKIIACAYSLNDNDLTFVTNDICCKHIARQYFQKVESIEPKYDEYTGFIDVYLNEDEMAYVYEHMNENIFNLYTNQYLIIRDEEKNVVDKLCWNGEAMRPINYNSFRSFQFGEVKPMKDDPYQALAVDSFNNNVITMIKGPAGSGKTYLSLGFLMSKLEKHAIDKIIIFCNTVATKGSAKLGFYPGTRDEKLLDSQIGNMLASKLGDRIAVEDMIESGKLVLLPLSDIRGYDTTGMRAGIYISEAQNMNIDLMKLTLQRIGNDSICIIDGDEKTQVDDVSYAGENNGMRRASEVFRGEDIYGEVTLQKVHRSRIAEIAEQL